MSADYTVTITCDKCGKVSEPGTTAKRLRARLRASGWRKTTTYSTVNNRYGQVSIDLCPDCIVGRYARLTLHRRPIKRTLPLSSDEVAQELAS
jgi:hypothetical protein